MARSNKEQAAIPDLSSIEGQQLWFSAALLALAGAIIETEDPATQQEVAKALIDDMFKEVGNREVDDELFDRADGLFAVAFANLNRLDDPEYLKALVSEWFPSTEERLITQLLIIQDEYDIGVRTIGRLVRAIKKPDKTQPDRILESLNIIVRKLKRRPDRVIFKTVLDFVVLIWPDLTLEQRTQFQQVFRNLSISLAKHDPIGTSEMYILWQDKLHQISKESDINRPELGLVHIASSVEPQYSEVLLRLVPAQAFDALGYALRNGAREHAVTATELVAQFSNVLTVLEDFPPLVIERMLHVYTEAGFTRRFKSGKFKLTKRGASIASLGYSELETVQMATRILSERKGRVPGGIKKMEDISTAYEAYQDSITIPEKIITIDGDHRRILYLADLLFGQKDLSTGILKSIIEQIKLMPEAERPHHVVISGLVAGAFQFRQKDKRAALALSSMDDQFAAAKVFIDELLDLGLEISYVLSSEDLEQARNYTLMALKALEYWKDPQADSQKKYINYWQEAQMRQPGKEPGQADAWDIHYDFQINVVFPYYLRSGRRLRSADEIFAQRIVREEYRNLSEEKLLETPGVYVRQEEYLLLYDAYQRLCRGETLPAHYKDILEIDNIPLPGKSFENFGIYNGLKLVAHTEGSQYTSLLHHNGLEFSPTGLKKVPLQKILDQLGDLAAAGQSLPDEVVTFHQQQGMGLGGVVSLPGFSGVNILQRTQSFAVSGEIALRQIGRGTGVPNPGAIMRTIYDDGRVVTTFLTQRQLETAHQGKRTAWLFDSDLHVGNVASAPDKYLRHQDYALKQIVPAYDQVVVVRLGDDINARNVSTAPEDNDLVGLPRLEHMEAMLHLLIEIGLTQGRSYDDLPEFLKKIVHVYLATGNHELNTGKRRGTLHSYALGTTELLKRILGKDKVTYFGSMKGPEHGQVIIHPGGITQSHGGTRALGSHKLYWGRFGGGNGVLDGQKITRGLGAALPPDVNLLVMGDQHVGKWGFASGKLVLVVPSSSFTTGFEFGLGLWTEPGAMAYVSGGGKAPELHEFPLRFIANHKITSGPLTDEAIADSNPRLATDPDFKPGDGLYTGPYMPHDALQKWILHNTSQIVAGNLSPLRR